jgi:hypothetical protein
MAMLTGGLERGATGSAAAKSCQLDLTNKLHISEFKS